MPAASKFSNPQVDSTYERKELAAQVGPVYCTGKCMHRMLIVEDKESIRFAMSNYFKVHSYLVDCAQRVEKSDQLAEDFLCNLDFCTKSRSKTRLYMQSLAEK